VSTAIQDEELMPSERRFRHDATKSTRFHKPDDGDDRMNKKEEDVVHAGILSKSQKLPEFRPILEFATDTWMRPDLPDVLFGRLPSLHALRRRSPTIVRALRR
jgi:hypothetical protein